MLKKTVTYVDFDGNKRTEDFYFNLMKSELVDMQWSCEGGVKAMIEKIIQEKNEPRLIELFKEIVLKAYGEKSPDGRRFIKTEDVQLAFSQTQAYSDIFMELATDANSAINFVNGIMPADLMTKIDANTESIPK